MAAQRCYVLADGHPFLSRCCWLRSLTFHDCYIGPFSDIHSWWSLIEPQMTWFFATLLDIVGYRHGVGFSRLLAIRLRLASPWNRFLCLILWPKQEPMILLRKGCMLRHRGCPVVTSVGRSANERGKNLPYHRFSTFSYGKSIIPHNLWLPQKPHTLECT